MARHGGEQVARHQVLIAAVAMPCAGPLLLGGAGRVTPDHWGATLAGLGALGGLDPDLGQDGVLTGTVGTRT